LSKQSKKKESVKQEQHHAYSLFSFSFFIFSANSEQHLFIRFLELFNG
jgi:hypothetical protein